jgi:hypothetical protein
MDAFGVQKQQNSQEQSSTVPIPLISLWQDRPATIRPTILSKPLATRHWYTLSQHAVHSMARSFCTDAR